MLTRILHKILITIWVLGYCIHATAYNQVAQPASWSSTSSYRTSYQSAPSYSQAQNTSRTYTPASRSISAYNPDFGEGAKLSTYFRSTTADALLSDYSAGASAHGNSRRSWDWSEPTDNPVGVVTNPTPIGEPLVLLAMALLYGCVVWIRRRGYLFRHHVS